VLFALYVPVVVVVVVMCRVPYDVSQLTETSSAVCSDAGDL